jgi:hypothetical protein
MDENMECERCYMEAELVEFVDFMICEECLELLLNGPTEMDEIDELAEELENMHTD